MGICVRCPKKNASGIFTVNVEHFTMSREPGTLEME